MTQHTQNGTQRVEALRTGAVRKEASASFLTGRVWISTGVLKSLERWAEDGVENEIKRLLRRHVSGDPGALNPSEARSVEGIVRSEYGENLIVETDLNEHATYVSEGGVLTEWEGRRQLRPRCQ
jgi:hypothetical protein